MKSFVITIMDMPESFRAAEKCIQSGAGYGIEIEMFSAITPKDDPTQIMQDAGIETHRFIHDGKYSRTTRCMSAFLSHYSLWKKCVEMDEVVLIFEHDAVVEGNIPTHTLDYVSKPMLISFGAPSYGQFKTPPTIGLNNLVSKEYLPGAHSYMVNPRAAKTLINRSKSSAGPTDTFINKNTFNFLYEWSPFPVVAKDTFTTIQRREGCAAKHSFGASYDII